MAKTSVPSANLLHERYSGVGGLLEYYEACYQGKLYVRMIPTLGAESRAQDSAGVQSVIENCDCPRPRKHGELFVDPEDAKWLDRLIKRQEKKRKRRPRSK